MTQEEGAVAATRALAQRHEQKELVSEAAQTAPLQWPLAITSTALTLLLFGLLRVNATAEPFRRALWETLGVGGLCAFVAFGVGWMVGG